MRISPPLAVLLILAIGLALSTFTDKMTDCAFSPDGNLRWDSTDDWFTDPGYLDNYASFIPNCDVWNDLQPKKPLGTIELNWKTEASTPIIGRLLPDGTGLVAVFPADSLQEYEALSGDVDEFTPVAEIEKVARVFKSNPAQEDKIYSIRNELAPMRDFQGDPEAWFGPLTPELLKLFEINHPDTRFLRCRRQVHTTHWFGVTLTYGSEISGGSPRIFMNRECLDVAFAGMAAREQAAISRLIEVTGAGRYISQETPEKYPNCKPSDWDRCFGSYF